MNAKITDDAHLKLLRLVEGDPNISQRQLAKEMGVSLGKVNYCLKALLSVGLIKVGNFAKSKQKKNYAYLITPKGVKEKAIITARFLAAKQVQYESLRKEIEQLEEEVGSAASRLLNDDKK